MGGLPAWHCTGGIYSSTMARVQSILGFLAPVASLQAIWLTVFGGVRKERGRSRTSPAGTAYGVELGVSCFARAFVGFC